MEENKIGVVLKYYPSKKAIAIKLEGTIKEGMNIHIRGPVTDFEMLAESIQIDGMKVTDANSGDEIGLFSKAPAEPGDEVFSVIED